MSIRLLLSVVFSSLMLTLSGSALAQSKIGVVDLRRAVAQTEDGLRAQATIKKLFESKQQELNKKQGELGKQRDELAKQEKVLAKDVFMKKAEEWQKAMMELQQVFVQYNQELEKEERKATEPIAEKIQGIIKRIATADNYDAIIDRSAVPYMKDSLDLTDRCIKEYNAKK